MNVRRPSKGLALASLICFEPGGTEKKWGFEV